MKHIPRNNFAAHVQYFWPIYGRLDCHQRINSRAEFTYLLARARTLPVT